MIPEFLLLTKVVSGECYSGYDLKLGELDMILVGLKVSELERLIKIFPFIEYILVKWSKLTKNITELNYMGVVLKKNKIN